MKPTRRALAATALTTLLAVTGCAAPTQQPAQSSAPATSAPATATMAPAPTSTSASATVTKQQALALEAARIMSTWDAAKDFNRTASEKRAAHLIRPDRAAAIEAPERPASGLDWQAAVKAKARSLPTVTLSKDMEGDYTAVNASWQWQAEDGSTFIGTEKRVYYFTFTPGDDPKINDYTYDEIPDGR